MTGIDKIWETILDHRKRLINAGELEAKRQRQALDWMWSLIEEGLRDRFRRNPYIKKHLPEVSREVEKGITTPTIAATRLLSYLDDRK
jgi:LAO/AO transport system kinase